MREFQTQLLHYFSKSDKKSNHHHVKWNLSPQVGFVTYEKKIAGVSTQFFF